MGKGEREGSGREIENEVKLKVSFDLLFPIFLFPGNVLKDDPFTSFPLLYHVCDSTTFLFVLLSSSWMMSLIPVILLSMFPLPGSQPDLLSLSFSLHFHRPSLTVILSLPISLLPLHFILRFRELHFERRRKMIRKGNFVFAMLVVPWEWQQSTVKYIGDREERR